MAQTAQKASKKHAPAAALAGFAKRLRDLRRQQNLSQIELGQAAGLHYTNISRYERGFTRPTADALKRLADALNVSGDFLLEGTTEEAATARFEDRDLLQQFREVDQMPQEEKAFVKKLLEAVLVKWKLRELAR